LCEDILHIFMQSLMHKKSCKPSMVKYCGISKPRSRRSLRSFAAPRLSTGHVSAPTRIAQFIPGGTLGHLKTADLPSIAGRSARMNVHW
jgi:hypothetical protein